MIQLAPIKGYLILAQGNQMLRIPKSVDYSVLILITLYRLERDGLKSAQQIADETRLPARQVAKLLKMMQRSGLVKSVRGAAGGYRLMRREVSFADIFHAIEGPPAIAACLAAGHCDCRVLPDCLLKPHLGIINQTLNQSMTELTLAQIAEPSQKGAAV